MRLRSLCRSPQPQHPYFIGDSATLSRSRKPVEVFGWPVPTMSDRLWRVARTTGLTVAKPGCHPAFIHAAAAPSRSAPSRRANSEAVAVVCARFRFGLSITADAIPGVGDALVRHDLRATAWWDGHCRTSEQRRS